MGHPDHSRREEVGKGHRSEGEHARHHEGGSDNVRHGIRNNRVEEVASGGGNRHDDRRSHDQEVVRDDHSSHLLELHNRHHYDGVGESVSGSDRVGLRLESSACCELHY